MIDEHAVAESCNGADDDCDGEVDEHATDESCNAADDDCDGTVDEGLSCAPPDAGVLVPEADGGIGGAPDGGVPPGSGTLGGDCGCRATGAGGTPPTALVLLGLALLALRRRRSM
jgi:MYXO-CTERM domain-containing protein